MSNGEGEGSRGTLLKGTLDLLVLRILAGGAKHGYAISARLGELSDDWLRIDEGSLYPCLYRMEQRGWIESTMALTENKRRARYYTLTARGSEELEAQRDNWRQFSGIVAKVLQKG